jgi:hypothetical protein
LRAVAPRLPARQSWRLIDNDLGLLARAAQAGGAPQRTVTARPVDLARDLELALEGPLDLVTTSALLDLVSPDWLERLATEAAVRRLPVYAALTYDGEVGLEPADPLDRAVVAAVNRHQRTDKGFGPALGPSAPQAAKAAFAAVGYQLTEGRSDWRFGADDRAIQHAVVEGFAQAARELGELAASEIDGWLRRRLERIEAAASTMTVGHVDLFAWPIGRR